MSKFLKKRFRYFSAAWLTWCKGGWHIECVYVGMECYQSAGKIQSNYELLDFDVDQASSLTLWES